jgi:hypothetical protein
VLDQPDLEFIFGLDMLRKHQVSKVPQFICFKFVGERCKTQHLGLPTINFVNHNLGVVLD